MDFANKENNTFILHPYNFVEEDEHSPENDNVAAVVRIFAFEARTNTPHVVTIRGVQPWCFIELPITFNVSGSKRSWTPLEAVILVKEMRERFKVTIKSHSLVFKSKLYYYQSSVNAFPMLKLAFESIGEMRRFASRIDSASAIPDSSDAVAPSKFQRGPSSAFRGRFYGEHFGWMVLRAWEADSTISLVRKMLTAVDMKFANWFRVRPNYIIEPADESGEFTCRELVIGPAIDIWRNGVALSPLSEVEASTIPLSTPVVFAFDIECYSDNHLAFPVALNPFHTAYMISCVHQIYGKPETRVRTLIYTRESSVKADLGHPAFVSTATTVDSFVVAENERELLREFINLIDRINPDIISGYNIHGFDYKYLDTRYRLFFGDSGGVWPSRMSRSKTASVTLKSKKWKSGAYGYIETHILDMPGRISVDLMPLIKRDYKLSKYSLDVTSKFFLGDAAGGKHDVTPKQMFESYEAAARTFAEVNAGTMFDQSIERVSAVDAMTRVAAYAMQDSELVMNMFDKLNVWIGLVEVSTVAGVSIQDTFSRGQQCRIVSLLYDLATRKNVVMDKRKLPRAWKPRVEGEEEAVDEDSVIRYTGGVVQNPVVGLHDDVLCLDFASLYPSIMRAYNMSHDTLDITSTPLEERAFTGKVAAAVAYANAEAQKQHRQSVAISGSVDFPPKYSDHRYSSVHLKKSDIDEVIFIEEDGGTGVDEHVEDDDKVNNKRRGNDVDDDDAAAISSSDDDDIAAAVNDDDDVDVNVSSVCTPTLTKKKGKETTTATKPKHSQRYTFRFVKRDIHEGLLPALVADLVQKRRDVRALISSASPLMKVVLNQRQLAYKVTANSAYGFFGAQKKGMYPLVEGAMSVTAMGRQLIGKVNKYVEDTYGGKIVYGDSVTGDTALVLKNSKNGDVFVSCFEDLAKMLGARWSRIRRGRGGGDDKEGVDLRGKGIEVWTAPGVGGDGGGGCFKPVKYLIRHSTIKAIVRVVTRSGIVDCTTDHSLFRLDGSVVSPTGLKHGENLLHVSDDSELVNDWKKQKKNVDYKCCANDGTTFITYHHQVSATSNKIDATVFCLNARRKGFWPIIVKSTTVAVDAEEVFIIKLSSIPPPVASASSVFYNEKIKNEGVVSTVYDLEVNDESHRFNVGPGNLVVHNTDSSMFILPNQIKNARDCDEWGHRLATETSALFPPPLTLEFEKSMRILLLKKKKYAALLIEPSGAYAPKMLTRGIVMERRDNCKFIRSFYEKILSAILRDSVDADVAFGMIMSEIINAFNASSRNRSVAAVDFEVVKSIGTDYKSASYQMAVFGDECAKAGRPARPGDRLGFVIADRPSSIPDVNSSIKPNNLGYKMRLTEVFIEEGTTTEIDVLYYCLHMFMNPIDQLFAVTYGPLLHKIGVTDAFKFKPRSNVTYECTHPIKMLCGMTRHTNASLKRKKDAELDSKTIVHLAKTICDTFSIVYKQQQRIKMNE